MSDDYLKRGGIYAPSRLHRSWYILILRIKTLFQPILTRVIPPVSTLGKTKITINFTASKKGYYQNVDPTTPSSYRKAYIETLSHKEPES